MGGGGPVGGELGRLVGDRAAHEKPGFLDF